MTNIKKINRALLLLGIVFSLTNYSCNAVTPDVNENPEKLSMAETQTSNVIEVAQKTESVKVFYKTFPGKQGKPAPTAVFVGNYEVIRYNVAAGGFSPEMRAKVLVSRLESFVKENGNAKKIFPGMKGGSVVGRTDNQVLFTADVKNAKAVGLTTGQLAIKWANNLRVAFGAPKLVRNYSLIASRNGISTAFIFDRLDQQEVGIASYYGGVFHGRRSADGSRFSSHEFTAAHKTLPFGTVVRVTNLRNGRTCLVRITDRGPFVRGRIIDLSTAAAREIDMLSSGISRVKVERVAMY